MIFIYPIPYSQDEIPKTIERKAAMLFYGILTSHPFMDGNKRSAVIATQTFLEQNGKKFHADDEELWNVVHDVSTGKLKFEKVVNWIREKIR